MMQYITSFLQTLYYRVVIPAGRPHPQPGQPLYAYHHRRIRIAVLCLYLVYILFQTLYDIRLAGDLYTALGVTPYSTEREVRARFRRLAARFHPDKVRDGSGSNLGEEAAFVRLKLAQDTILDPTKRFAYDRFGPAILRVQHPGLKTIRDYVYAGLQSLIPEYVKGAISLIVLNYFWLPKWGQFWRYLAIASLIFLELYFLTHTWEPPRLSLTLAGLLHRVVPGILPHHLLPFQILELARRMSLSINIFISQLAPPSARGTAAAEQQTQQQIAMVNQTASRIDAEATGLLNLGFVPFKGDAEKVEMLRRGMKEGIMLGAIRNMPEVREAVRDAIDRHRPPDTAR